MSDEKFSRGERPPGAPWAKRVGPERMRTAREIEEQMARPTLGRCAKCGRDLTAGSVDAEIETLCFRCGTKSEREALRRARDEAREKEREIRRMERK